MFTKSLLYFFSLRCKYARICTVHVYVQMTFFVTDVTDVTDVTYIKDVADVADVTDVTDITDVTHQISEHHTM